MHLLTLIFGTVFLQKAYTLQCYECVPNISGTCNEVTKVCTSQQTQCGAVRVQSYAGGSKLADISVKSCVSPEECLSGSVNFGIAKSVIASNCCSSNLCNSQSVPDPGKASPNGKKCFTCNAQTKECTATLNCEGTEDSCLTATVPVGAEKVTLKGCVSKEFCSRAQNPNVTAIIGSQFTCCQGDYCNSASRTSSGLLLLVAPLIYIITFS